MTAVIYRCDNCDCVGLRANMKDAKDMHLRMEPGDTYTDAECPKCGAFAFPENVPLALHQHQWSGWPGAFCMKCGAPHLLEQALADNVYDPETDTWTDEGYKQTVEDFDGLCPISDIYYKEVMEPARREHVRAERAAILSDRLKRDLQAYVGKEITDELKERLSADLSEIFSEVPMWQISQVAVCPEQPDKINLQVVVPRWLLPNYKQEDWEWDTSDTTPLSSQDTETST